MPYDRPSVKTLIDRTNADIEARMPGTHPRLRRSVVGDIGRVVAASHHALYGYIDYLAKQILSDTAEDEWLERHASIYKIKFIDAAKATGFADLTGSDGSVVVVGKELQTADGIEYVTTEEVTISSGVASVAIKAKEAGVAGNQIAGVALSFSSSIPGVDSTALIDSNGLAGGAEKENHDSLRARLALRKKQPPQGGADFDYKAWAYEVAGVTRAWVYPLELGGGTVVVRFMMDNNYSDGIPLSADVTAVQDHIDNSRPVTANLTVVAPIASPLNFTISNLSPNTSAVKASIEAELKDLIMNEGVPGGTILISHIREAISIAAGESNHILTSPAADVTHTTGQIAVFGVITWA